ncbi:hypothetical protein [Pseudomonas sp. 22 E 5]|nr:hypothetical protein [Pseudomonas sp. 22 E 5]
MPMCRFCGLKGTMSWPSSRILPLSTEVNPAMQRSRVDLPQPDGPSRVTNSPLAISQLISLNTGVPV